VGIEKPMATERWLAIADRVIERPSASKPPISTVPKHCRGRLLLDRGLGLTGDSFEGVRRALDYLHRYETRKFSNDN